MGIFDSALAAELDRVRDSQDPRAAHDDLARLRLSLRRHGQPVPARLNTLIADLEAEIVERYFDNMPV
jgi:hypothetical protein